MTAETVTRTAPPTEADIRAAVTARLDADDYGRPDDWLAYFSDGLRGLWQADRDEYGDLLLEDPELGALADAAEARLAPAVIALAVEEFTAAGLLYAARCPDAPWTAPTGEEEPEGSGSPSRAEIRQAIDGIDIDPDAGGQETSDTASDAFGKLWKLDDLRPSEGEAYATIVSAAMDRVGGRLRAIIAEELLTAGLELAAEFPEAPRA